MTLPFAIVLSWAAALSQVVVPVADSRQVDVPGVKTHFKMPEYASRKDWEARKARLREQILSAAGLLPMPERSPLRPKVVRRLTFPDYSIETVLIETLPGYYLGGNVYLPRGKKEGAPAVLIPHGHWKRGRIEDLPSYSVPALGINLARQGYVAISYDMVGYNDTTQTPHSFGGWEEELWSFNPMGLQLWNSMRVVDYLQSRPEVDGRRIAITGASGGGTQTFLLAAVDDRIGYAAPVNMVSAYMQGGDPCEEAPGLRLDTSNVEIAAMMAPRPMLLVSSTHDWTRHTPVEEFPEIRHIYELYGAAESVHNAHVDAEHNYNRQSREAVYRFLAKVMMPGHEPADLRDKDITAPPDEDMLAFPKNGPREAGGYNDVFEAWKVAAMLGMDSGAQADARREALRLALSAEWPAQVESNTSGKRIVISRKGSGDRIPGYWVPGKGSPILVVHPGGSLAALRSGSVQNFLRSGRPVLVIDPFTSGRARAERESLDAYFLSYNRTDDAIRVQDILTALAFLKGQGNGKTELIGMGDAGVWCVFAAAIAPVGVRLVVDLNGFGGSDRDFHDRFFVPGIQRAGGLSGALGLLNHVQTLIQARAQSPAPAEKQDGDAGAGVRH
jgi:dienelactone hydrolase